MRPLTLAVVQFTPAFGKKDENLKRMHDLVADVSADIFVFPELCTTGYFFLSRAEVAHVAESASGRSAAFFRDMARQKGAVVAAGFAEQARGRLYNSCIIAIPEERNIYVYRKTHLFYKEQLCFDPGDTGFFVVADKKRDIKIGPMVCYDWRFPESARVLMLLGADLIVCPANLVTEAWQVVMPARAIENGVYLAVANRAGRENREQEELVFKGQSAIYDHTGQILQQAGSSDDEVLLAEILPPIARNKRFNPFNDVLSDRQPQHYGLIARTISK